MAASQRPLPPPEWDLILSYAQKNWPDKIVDLLTNGGVSPDHCNAVGQTALHIASLWGHVDAVRVLLEGGANPNSQNRLMGSTPLHMVAQSHKAKIDDALAVVDLLVSHGADVSLPDRGGNVPASCVPVDADPSKRPLAERLQPQKPALVEAIAAANVAEARQLLEDDDSHNAVNEAYMGKTPVRFALDRLIERSQDATSGSDAEKDDACRDAAALFSVLELLVGRGGRLSAHGGGESSPAESFGGLAPLPRLLEELRIAFKLVDSAPESSDSGIGPVVRALEGAVRLLVEKLGVPLTRECTDFLHQACRRNEVSMATFMVEQLRVDPNTRGRQGMTPLQFAARSGQMRTLRYLLSLPNVDATIGDDRGQTAMDAARVNDKAEALQALEQHAQMRKD